MSKYFVLSSLVLSFPLVYKIDGSNMSHVTAGKKQMYMRIVLHSKRVSIYFCAHLPINLANMHFSTEPYFFKCDVQVPNLDGLHISFLLYGSTTGILILLLDLFTKYPSRSKKEMFTALGQVVLKFF
jgi:hypothetical protein